jgi:hypothetical protein
MITVVDRVATAPVTVVTSKSSTLVVQSPPAQAVVTTVGRRGPGGLPGPPGPPGPSGQLDENLIIDGGNF